MAARSVEKNRVFLLVEEKGAQSRLHLQRAVVFDQTHLPKPIHKVTYSRASCTHHLGQGSLADMQDSSVSSRWLSKVA
jgi:hypothetical protein